MKPLGLSPDKCAQSMPYSFRDLMDRPPAPQVIHEAQLKVFLGTGGGGVSREAVGRCYKRHTVQHPRPPPNSLA